MNMVNNFKYVSRLEYVLKPILANGVNLNKFLVVEGGMSCGSSHILTVDGHKESNSVPCMDTRYFLKSDKFHHDFDHLIFSVKRAVGSDKMNIALGGHSNLVTRLRSSVGLTYSGFSRTYTQHVTLVSIPKTCLVGEGDIATIVDKATNLWKRRMITQFRKCG